MQKAFMSGATATLLRATRCAATPVRAARSHNCCLPTSTASANIAASTTLFCTRRLHTSRPKLVPDKVGGRQSTDQGTDGGHTSPTQQPEAEASGPKPTLGRSTSLFDIDTSTSSLIEAPDATSGKDGTANDAARTGAKGKRSMSSIDKNRRTRTRVLLGIAGLCLAATVVQAGREMDEREAKRFEDNPLKDSWFGRLWLRTTSMKEDLNAPAWEKLLPDPLPFPYSRPYTLVVDLDGLMTHSAWSREHGWRTAKRPGLDYFLGYLSQWYEIVLYTSQPFYTAGPVIEKLDPDRRFLTYLLFRESCRSVDGKIVKDLDALNRDLNKVIILDTKNEGFALHPQNAVLVKKWEGNKDDRELIHLIPFLEAIGIYEIPNVRKTIEAYKDTHIPTEHAKRTLEMRAVEYEQWKQKKEKLGSGGGLSLFGGGASRQSVDDEFKTWYDRERERFQQAHLEEEKYWKENGEEIRRQAKEDQERQLKEMKTNAWSFLMGGAKPGQDENAAQGAAPAS
ncbi:NIF-domain-containing protein [Tilletiaria anomala UBC 951]|uniref:Mitochondrial import inner membrane translocase subunit TIM50 n=1 Tax=Tilletiaria anomala (strain ATCC 24038 / CBS 436.72 / UBC 951) TaxID=1037660 RepID=A0A066VHD7_TILAU|nr:NIF-domain-containing protein [Tilletiaria anomala UBC 951]KDN37990.1 NIF-domain-containing protein [Tilletiaria anomala UBC 951]